MAEKLGFQPIGSLISRIASMPSAEDGEGNASLSKSRRSATIIPPRQRLAPTGTPHGEPGSVALTNSRRATAVVAAATAGDLQRNPARLLPQCVRSSIVETWDDYHDTKYGWDGRVSRYRVVRPVPEAERELALAITEEALRPMSEKAVIAEFGRLRMLTVSRDVGEDLGLVFAAYADGLMRYPADAVREVLRAWPRRHRFWPAMVELVEQLDVLVAPRQALHEALRRGYRPPATSTDWVAPSAEDHAAVLSLLAKHGFTVDHTGRVRPPEREPMSRDVRHRVADETRTFRLPDEDDPRVQARLREMGITNAGAHAAA